MAESLLSEKYRFYELTN